MKIIRLFVEYALIILFVVLLRMYIITPVQVNGDSMQNTLFNNDIMLLNIIGYRSKAVERFDIIVFKHNDEALIKRVIGLPGESITYKDNKLFVDDVHIEEKFLVNERTDDFTLFFIGKEQVPENMYFVLGDNRNNSTDSRYIGFISKEDIMGKTNLVVYPFKHFGWTR